MRRKVLKKKYQNLCKMLLGGAAVFGGMFANQHPAQALPVEPTTIDRANINSVLTSGDIMNITGTGNAFIRWNDFSIRPGETVNFSGMTNMLNYVGLQNPSLIYGTINAPNVKDFYVINPSGILFGPDSKVVTNNLYVSTRSLTENDISAYISGGTNPLETSIDVSRINDGGLKSSDIMGAYDIADGDVMFLGQVQANSLKVEGNTIQIRNTANIKNKDGTAILEGDAVNLISNNPIEVGYEVTTNSASDIALTNPFDFDLNEIDDKEKFILALAKQYGIYLFQKSDGEVITTTDDVGTEYQNNVDISNSNYAALENLYTFYKTQVDAASTDNDKILVAMAMDEAIKDNIGKTDGKMKVLIYPVGVVEALSYMDTVSTLTWTDTDTNSKYTSALTTAQNNHKDVYKSTNTSSKYKYLIADALGDENMTNSANKLEWKAETLNGSTQTITDYRLVTSATDLQNINFSRWTAETQLSPVEGTIHGNYMLSRDIDASSISAFKPLGYNMTYADYASPSDAINFNGLNFKISNLTTDNEVTDTVGLFSVFSGTVKNLRLQNFTVGEYEVGTWSSSYSSNAGALAGAIAYLGGTVSEYSSLISKNNPLNTSIKNVSLSGNSSINGTTSGGLVGIIGYGDSEFLYRQYSFHDIDDWDNNSFVLNFNKENVELDWDYTLDGKTYSMGESYYVYSIPGFPTVNFDNIENFASVNASTAGGILGYKEHGSIFFTNSTNFGAVTSDYDAGGIVGYSQSSYEDRMPSLDSSDKSVAFERVSNSGTISGKAEVGGIIGSITNEDSFNIIKSWNEGNVTSSDSSGNAGGIAGYVSANLNKADQVFNVGDITGKQYVGGLFGYWSGGTDWSSETQSSTTNSALTNSYNSGNVSGGNGNGRYTGGIIGYLWGGKLSNVYNSGDLFGYYVGGLLGRSYSSADEVTNSYNIGTISNKSYYPGGIVGNIGDKKATFTNVYNANGQSDLDIFGSGSTPQQTNVKNVDDNPDVSEIYSTWNIDSDGTDSSKLWRVYTNPDDLNDKTRQPLLMEFLQNATIQRYNELDKAGEVDPADLVSVEELNMHALHESSGKITDIRYKNTGKSSLTADKTEFYTVNPDFIDYDIISSSDTDKKQFSVNDTTYFAEALMKSSQFGYNFQFENNTEDWTAPTGTDSDLNDKIADAETNPTDSAIYLKMGVNNIPTPPDTKPIEEFTGTEENEEDIYYTITINVSGGAINPYAGSWESPYNFDITDENSNYKPGYTTNNPSNVDLSDFTISGEVIDVDGNKKTSATIEHGKYYTVGNGGLTDNGDGTYSVKIKVSNHVYYNFVINPGNITSDDPSENTKEVYLTLNVANGSYKNEELILTPLDNDSYYEVGADGLGIDESDVEYIANLLDGILEVVDENDEHTTTTVVFDETKVDSVNKTNNSDGTTTYTVVKDGNTYEFKRDGMTFEYVIDADTDHGTTFYISLYPGSIKSNKFVTISLVDGKVKDGNLTLNTVDGKDYSVTGDGADFINEILTTLDILETKASEDGKTTELNFKGNVESYEEFDGGTRYEFYNDDNENYLTIYKSALQDNNSIEYIICDGDGSWLYPSPFIKNDDGIYTYEDNNVVYNITVEPGEILSGTKIPVTINVNDGKVVDGDFISNSYDVTNNDIKTLLQNTLEVFNDNGKTNVRFKDEISAQKTTNADDGTITYNVTKGGKTYEFTKNTEGTFTYEVENNGDTTTYEVTVEQGEVDKIYNIDIQVSDGVYYINPNGDNTLSLDLTNGYKITKNADGSNFTDNFEVKYNDPADVTKITGPATTTVSVTNKNTKENYNTSDVSATTGVYKKIMSRTT